MHEVVDNPGNYLGEVLVAEPKIEQRMYDLEGGFRHIYGREVNLIVRAPGRVELIGNHTDYALGKAAGVTLNSSTLVGISLNNSDKFRVFSQNMDAKEGLPHEINPFDMRKSPEGASDEWLNYIKGVVEIIRARFGGGKLAGVDIFIESDIPPGGGFSSSAALELAIAQAICEINHIDLASKGMDPLLELILLAQKAETGPYVRARTGLLDQTTSAAGGIAFIDFKPIDERTPISFARVNLNLEAMGKKLVVVSDPELKHNLAASGGGYNERVLECHLSIEFINRYLGQSRKISSLREVYDLSLSDEEKYSQYQSLMDSLFQDQNRLARRVMHVVQEIHRVDAAYAALQKGDIYAFGKLMIASGRSALEEYDIGDGVPELLWTYEKALTIPGVLGVRNMGGGFNNATLWLVESAQLPDISQTIQTEYQHEFGSQRKAQLNINPFSISPGVGILKKKII